MVQIWKYLFDTFCLYSMFCSKLPTNMDMLHMDELIVICIRSVISFHDSLPRLQGCSGSSQGVLRTVKLCCFLSSCS